MVDKPLRSPANHSLRVPKNRWGFVAISWVRRLNQPRALPGASALRKPLPLRATPPRDHGPTQRRPPPG